MQGRMKFVFLSLESFVGKKDPTKTYFNVTLLQGSETVKIFLESGQEVLFSGIQKFDEIECLVTWRLGQDKYGYKIEYRLVEVNPLKVDLPELAPEIPDNKVTDLNSGKNKEKSA